MFERAGIDTVRNTRGGSPSLLEKIAEPIVVISGAILIVYFLFTVRS
jgi:hypothetical protein